MARGRKPGFVMSEEHRTKIANSQILKCLLDHVQGKREMSSTQVTAGLGLLRKVMPDLASVEHSGQLDLKKADQVSDDELANIAAGRSEGAATTSVDKTQLN